MRAITFTLPILPGQQEAWRRCLQEMLDVYRTDYEALRHRLLPLPVCQAGIEGQKQINSMYATAFPDTHFMVEDMIAEGDKVVARLTIHATQRGAFMSLPPTGKHVTFTGIDIIRIAGGKLVERWAETDILGLLQQLGVVPAPEQASS